MVGIFGVNTEVSAVALEQGFDALVDIRRKRLNRGVSNRPDKFEGGIRIARAVNQAGDGLCFMGLNPLHQGINLARVAYEVGGSETVLRGPAKGIERWRIVDMVCPVEILVDDVVEGHWLVSVGAYSLGYRLANAKAFVYSKC